MLILIDKPLSASCYGATNFFYGKVKTRETSVNTNPEMTDSAVLAMVLDDMAFLGLIELKPDEKLCSSATEGKRQAEDPKDSKKAA
jgi:hypothetical protein